MKVTNKIHVQGTAYGLAAVIICSSWHVITRLAGVAGIALLGEWPSEAGWIGIGLIFAGVYLASGAPMPGAAEAWKQGG